MIRSVENQILAHNGQADKAEITSASIVSVLSCVWRKLRCNLAAGLAGGSMRSRGREIWEMGNQEAHIDTSDLVLWSCGSYCGQLAPATPP